MDSANVYGSKVTYIHTGDADDDKMGELAALSIMAASPATATGLSKPVGIPPDRYHAARIIFLLLGVGILTPWNAFITAADYFGHLYPDYHVDRVIPVVYMLPNLLFLLALLQCSTYLTPHFRILLGFFLFFLVLIWVPILDSISIEYEDCEDELVERMDDLGFGSSCFNETISGDAVCKCNTFPLIPFEECVTLAGGDNDVEAFKAQCSNEWQECVRERTKDEWYDWFEYSEEHEQLLPDCESEEQAAVVTQGNGGLIAFLVTLVLVLVNGLADALAQGSLFGLAGNMPSQYTQALASGASLSGVVISLLRLITKGAMPQDNTGLRNSAFIYFIFAAFYIAFCICAYLYLHGLPVVRYYRHYGISAKNYRATRTDLKEMRNDAAVKGEKFEDVSGEKAAQNQELVFYKIWPFAIMLALVYTITLSIFPGAISEDVVSDTLEDWYPVLLITTFNVFDFLGKLLPGIPMLVIKSIRALWILTLLRLLFIPAFVLVSEGIIKSEAYAFILIALLGTTNGYVSSIVFMAAPNSVDDHEKESAGQQMVFFLMAGLVAGAFSGWLWLLG